MSKLFAVYTVAASEERYLGQAYLTEEDLQTIEQSFDGQLQSEHAITLTDGEIVDITRIDSIEEIVTDQE